MGKAELEASLNGLDIWIVIFGIFVAIGAVGGSVAGYLHWRRSTQLQELQAAENLGQQQSIARLVAEAETARAAIAEANARAAEAALELAKFKAPRTLSIEQRHRITGKLRSFAGTRYDTGIGPINDPEPQLFMEILERSLDAAGWTQLDWPSADVMTLTRPNKRTMGGVSVTNVIIEYPPDSKTLSEAALSLATALSAEGIDARAFPIDGYGMVAKNTNTNAIHVIAGRKL